MRSSFRTETEPIEAPFRLSAAMKGVLTGSCFTDEIGGRMRASMWDVEHNPSGVLFNPASIAASIRLALTPPSRRDFRLFEADGLTRSWLFSTLFADSDAQTCRRGCAEAADTLAESLRTAGFLIVTFGSAFVYELEGIPVANCHKQPQRIFARRMLSPEEIAGQWRGVIRTLAEINSSLKIILTVSPVRHIGDSLHGNTLSKATLHLAVQNLLDGSSPLPLCYFPSYEMLIDDLRDYRFYAADMAHPSPVAVDYIWHRFLETFVSPEDRKTLEEGTSLTRALNHRPLNPGTDATRRFQEQTERRLAVFLAAHPYMRP